jgi:hypothetical protein
LRNWWQAHLPVKRILRSKKTMEWKASCTRRAHFENFFDDPGVFLGRTPTCSGHGSVVRHFVAGHIFARAKRVCWGGHQRFANNMQSTRPRFCRSATNFNIFSQLAERHILDRGLPSLLRNNFDFNPNPCITAPEQAVPHIF